MDDQTRFVDGAEDLVDMGLRGEGGQEETQNESLGAAGTPELPPHQYFDKVYHTQASGWMTPAQLVELIKGTSLQSDTDKTHALKADALATASAEPKGLESAAFKAKDAEYTKEKKELPCFGIGECEGMQRTLATFQRARYLSIDIDKLHHLYGGREFQQTRSYMAGDGGILPDGGRPILVYTTPSGIGIKLLYMLDRPIESAEEFDPLFTAVTSYLGGDLENNSAVRLSFVCRDPDAVYNPYASPIMVDYWLNAGGDEDAEDAEDNVDSETRGIPPDPDDASSDAGESSEGAESQHARRGRGRPRKDGAMPGSVPPKQKGGEQRQDIRPAQVVREFLRDTAEDGLVRMTDEGWFRYCLGKYMSTSTETIQQTSVNLSS